MGYMLLYEVINKIAATYYIYQYLTFLCNEDFLFLNSRACWEVLLLPGIAG